MKNVVHRVRPISFHGPLALGSAPRGPISNACAFCLHLTGSRTSSSQLHHPSLYDQRRFHTREESDAGLKSLRSEIETKQSLSLGEKFKQTSSKGFFLPPQDHWASPVVSAASSQLEPPQPEVSKCLGDSIKDEAELQEAFLLEDILDSRAEKTRQEFFSNPDQLPELIDIVALKPPRLEKYIVGTPRTWYIDKYNTVFRRLMRAFTKSQLEHLCRLLGFQQQEEAALNSRGIGRLKELKLENPSLSVKDLRQMVLAEANPSFKTNVKRRDPSDASYTKTDLVHFVLTKHWGLTDPRTIPLPIDLGTLTHRFLSNSEVFEMPYQEVFLLYLEQTRSPQHNLLTYLSRRFNVSVDFAQDPTGLTVKGEMKRRDAFWRSFEKKRRPIHEKEIIIPQLLKDVVLTPKHLKSLSELSGCYLELTSERQGSLMAYCYEDHPSTDNVVDNFTQLAILSGRRDCIPTGICLSRGDQPITSPQDLWLCPFLPVSKPSWYHAGIADRYGRLTSPRSRGSPPFLDKENPPEEAGCQTTLRLDRVQLLEGPMSDIRAWLTDVPVDAKLSIIELRATLGHWLYPRQDQSTLIGAKFPDNDSQLAQLRSWSSQATPRPFFLPGSYPIPAGSPSDFRLADQELFSPATEDVATVETARKTRVEVFRPPSVGVAPPSRRAEWMKSLRVMNLPDGTTQTEEICQKQLVIMMPSCPMDILLVLERRTPAEILDPSKGYQTGLTYFMHDGERLASVESYESHTTELLRRNCVQSTKFLRFRNERRVVTSFAPEAQIELRSELLMEYQASRLDEFISLSGKLAARSFNLE